jgi:protease-4
MHVLEQRLERAGRDDSVVALVAQLGPEALTASQAEEIGAAVERFAATGRPTVCWSESFGELGAGTVSYLLAAFFDQIWLQPTGSLGLLGVSSRGVFVRGALDRLGIEPQLGQRHEYKNAADLLLRSSMSEPNREALQRLADSELDQVVATTARR